MSRKRKIVIASIWSFALIALVGSIFFLQQSLTKIEKETKKDNITETKEEDIEEIQVNTEAKVIIKPYVDENIKAVKYFYDYQAEKTKQEQSIVYYENTYIQNSGIDYSGQDSQITNFDVVSILDGVVLDVKEDELLGKIIEVKYGDNLIASYQGLSEILVKKDDQISQNQTIGKSGTATMSSDLKDHLHFELYYKGQVVDPEKYYGKTLEEL